MPKPEARTTAAGRWSPRTPRMSSFETKACTAPERPKPRTSAHSVSQNMKKASRTPQPMSPNAVASNCVLTPLLARGLAAFGERVGDAVTQVIVEHLECDRLERLGDSGDLRQHVDAVGVLADHPLQAAH